MKFPRWEFLEFAGAAAAAPAFSRSASAQADATRRITIRPTANVVFWFSLAIASLTITIASHWPLTNGFFDVDDFLWLHLENWRSVLHSFVGTQGEHVAYRPIFRLSLYIDALLFERDAVGSHLENMLIHAVNSVLLAGLLRVFRAHLSVCIAAALLFALAPLSGEGVNWISGRTVVLSTTFILLSLWRWTVSLVRHTVPWAAIGWMIAAAATYEAAIVLPALCLSLVSLTCTRLKIDWLYAIGQSVLMGTCLFAFWIVRAAFLGAFIGQTSVPSYDLWGNFIHHISDLLIYARLLGGDLMLWLLAISLVLTTFIPRLFPAGPCLALMAAIFIFPFSMDPGTGGRFFYALQAPLCALLVLPASVVPRIVRIPSLALLLAALLPGFAVSTRGEAESYASAENKARALINAIHKAIPFNDGYAHVVEGVPDLFRGHLMFGELFELAIADTYSGPLSPPVVVRSKPLLGNATMLRDVLSTNSRFWLYDSEADRLVPLDRNTWIQTHPQAAKN
jgi:hypothetical protein